MMWKVTMFRCCLLLALTCYCVSGDQKQQPASDLIEKRITALSNVNNKFAFQLYRTIASGNESKNVFFSPLSVSMALSALSLGAEGETHQQLFSGLGFNTSDFTREEVHETFLNLLQSLNQRSGVQLDVGTALYVQETFKPHSEFLEKMQRFYSSDGFTVDFTNPTETANQINAYVSKKTHDKINNLVKDLDPRTIMYLLSYIYFKGKWSIQFDTKMTKMDNFHVDQDTTVPVEMMYNRDFFYGTFDHELATHVLRLDYTDDVSMILLLPEDSLDSVEGKLCPNHIVQWNRWMHKDEYKIYVPKLSLKTSYSLNKFLSDMGIEDMFTPKANFSGISDKNLIVSKAVHEATLDMDEAGATATAVTGLGIMPLSARIIQTLKFNQPFMIIITDQKTSNILFLGKIVNPKI